MTGMSRTGWDYRDTPRSEAIGRVLAAWTDPGRSAAYHRAHVARLRREWLMLARALDDLARAHERPTP